MKIERSFSAFLPILRATVLARSSLSITVDEKKGTACSQLFTSLAAILDGSTGKILELVKEKEGTPPSPHSFLSCSMFSSQAPSKKPRWRLNHSVSMGTVSMRAFPLNGNKGESSLCPGQQPRRFSSFQSEL